LIPGDMGRPLAHLKHKLDYANLIGDAEKVRDTLLPVEREVTDGVRWFLSRLQPYRTVEDHIGGVVLTLVDVTERKRSEQDLRDHVGELTRFNNAAVGRETRMIELKKEINALAARLGEQPKYPIREEE
jgi:two-component system CheB/CheR fusion protein